MRLCGPQIVFIVLVLILGVGSMLSACGKKGPLYLPDQNGEGRVLLTGSQHGILYYALRASGERTTLPFF
ncbi:MAG: lipoprotein [Proteobacteria bacterium]|nr:lipoprotein [Pseudomonadota bacterium]